MPCNLSELCQIPCPTRAGQRERGSVPPRVPMVAVPKLMRRGQWEGYMRYSACSRSLFYKLQSPNYFLFPTLVGR